MTRYIDLQDMQTLLRRVGAEAFIRQLAGYIRADYLRWNEFDKSARVANHSEAGVIELMPISDRQRYAFKYVNGHPGNGALKLPTVMAFGVLADVDTGYPQLLSELTLATALRTGATSALAAQHLARPGARRMAVIGNGAQSEFQILAFKALLGIDQVRIYDTDGAASAKLLRNLGQLAGLTMHLAGSVREAVDGADIVTTITADKHYATILTPDMIAPGMHLNAVGGDCPGKTELHLEIVRQARVIVEYEAQTRIEGEIQQLPADFPVTQLWQVLAGQQAGREHARQVTLFDSVGFALEDFSTLRYLHDLAREHDIGRPTELVPTPADPKDLFQYIAPQPNPQAVPRRAAALTA